MFRGAAVATDDRGRRTDCFKKGTYNISIVRTASIYDVCNANTCSVL